MEKIFSIDSNQRYSPDAIEEVIRRFGATSILSKKALYFER